MVILVYLSTTTDTNEASKDNLWGNHVQKYAPYVI